MGKATIALTAEDATAAAWASVQRNASTAIGEIKALIPGLATVLSAAGLIQFAKSGIDAADRMHDLSKSTDISVESLAGLGVLAKQTGTDLDGLAKGINRMSVEMGKEPEKFRELGITAKDNVGAFKQFADIFNKLPDIQQRNALAQAVFNKSWAEMAPALSLGSKKLGEAIDAGTKASNLTTEMARKADELNDKWVLLFESGGMVNAVLSEMYDPLLRITNQMIAAKNSTDAWYVSLYKFMTTGGDSDFNRWVKKQIGQIDELSSAMDGMKLGSGPRGDRASGGGSAGASAKESADATARAAAFLKTQADAQREELALAREIAAFNEHVDQLQMAQIIKTMDASHARYVEEKKDALEMANLAGELDRESAIAFERQRVAAEETRQAAIDQGLSVADSLRSEAELEVLYYDERLNNLNLYLAASNLSVAQSNAILQRAEQQHQAKLGSLSAHYAIERQKFAELNAVQQAQTYIGILTNLSSSMAAKNREMFELNKVASIANAIMYTYEGANKALGQGGIFGIAMAATIIAAGLANVANIAATRFGSGAPSAGGGGPGVTPVNQVPVVPQSTAGQTTIIHLEGNDNSTLTQKQVRALLKQIEEATRDGGKVAMG